MTASWLSLSRSQYQKYCKRSSQVLTNGICFSIMRPLGGFPLLELEDAYTYPISCQSASCIVCCKTVSFTNHFNKNIIPDCRSERIDLAAKYELSRQSWFKFFYLTCLFLLSEIKTLSESIANISSVWGQHGDLFSPMAGIVIWPLRAWSRIVFRMNKPCSPHTREMTVDTELQTYKVQDIFHVFLNNFEMAIFLLFFKLFIIARP